MATQSTQKATGGLLEELPIDRLREEAMEFGKAIARKGASRIGERLTGGNGKGGGLGDLVPGPGDMVKAAAKAPVKPVKEAASKVKDAIPGVGSDDDSGGGSKSGNQGGDDTNLKVTNIVEAIDVPVGRDVAYDLWTQFEEFPSFMKKVENVQQKDPEVVTWKAQIFWSHRTWTAKIVDQVPPERIVWKSEADKGKVDGAVTFHELAPDLTRVLVSLEYHPQGLFERTGNLWRAQGRRVRLEMKHFRRYVANHALLKQDDVDGWEGEIHDGKVKRRRSSSSGSTAKKSSSSGSTARKSSSSGSTAKKSSSGGSTAKKATSGSTAKKSASSGTAKKTAAKKSSPSGSTAKKATSGSTAKKSASSGARKSAAKKTTSKRTAAAAKTAPRRTTASASSAKGSSGGSRSSASKARRSSPKSTRRTTRSSGTRSRS